MNNEIKPKPLSVKEVLDGSATYRIPMYQRNYAWEEGEIRQLIQDVIDYCDPNDKSKERPYYIGTLVVYKIKDEINVYETIDGQQRLTTLALLASFLKNKTQEVSWYKTINIDFECREHSKKTFASIFSNKFQDDFSENLQGVEINTAILNGYQIIKKNLHLQLKEKSLSIENFVSYLFEKVQIMRVEVPCDTDLNHYFEIMNNRGEQLEKHEILKASLMAVFNDEKDQKENQLCLNTIWEACANMEKYVQAGFTPKQRDAIFGKEDWSELKVFCFDNLRDKLCLSDDRTKNNCDVVSLHKIISASGKYSEEKTQTDDTPDRFNSIINFPNFLLHVLRVHTKENIPLDDKRLISTFEENLLNKDDKITAVKLFIVSLLHCKYLFDRYILKREFIKEKDGWSLKRFKWGVDEKQHQRSYYVNSFNDKDFLDEDEYPDGKNRQILMLLAAFHVSTPTQLYKYWLNAALFWLYEESNKEKYIVAPKYLDYLESVAKAFVFDRFLASENPKDYFEIIYKNKGKCLTSQNTFCQETFNEKLTYGKIENNFVFNFLDYLLWIEHKDSDKIVKDYEFTFRSSVEHYYPQHPMEGVEELALEILNSFGNLCLISHSKNSRLSNLTPTAKKDYYKNTIDSIKQYLMMKPDTWDSVTIGEHGEKMKAVLLESIKDQ